MTVLRDLDNELTTYMRSIERVKNRIEQVTAEISKIDIPRARANLNRAKRDLDALQRTDLSTSVDQELTRLHDQEKLVAAKSSELEKLKRDLDETNMRLVNAHFDQQTQKRELKAKEAIAVKSQELAKKAKENELKLADSVSELDEWQAHLIVRQDRLRREHGQVKTERDILRTQLGIKDAEVASLRDDIQLKSSLLRTRKDRIARIQADIADQKSELLTETGLLYNAKAECARLNELETQKRRAEAELVDLESRSAKLDAKSKVCVNIHPLREISDPATLQLIESNKILRTKLASVYNQIGQRNHQIAALERRPVIT